MLIMVFVKLLNSEALSSLHGLPRPLYFLTKYMFTLGTMSEFSKKDMFTHGVRSALNKSISNEFRCSSRLDSLC